MLLKCNDNMPRACIKCRAAPRMRGQKTCRDCHAAYMRQWRRKRTARLHALEALLGEAHALVAKKPGMSGTAGKPKKTLKREKPWWQKPSAKKRRRPLPQESV